MRARLLAVALLFAGPVLHGLSGPAAEPLRPGVSLARDFRGQPVRAYAVELASGDYARVAVTLLGVWARIVARSPSGEEVLRVESLSDRYGVLAASVVAAEAGSYTFAVEAPSPTEEAAGTYRITLAARRPALPDDRVRTEAERTLAAAGMLAHQAGAADLAQSVSLARGTLPAWERLGDREGAAAAHYLIGLASLLGNRHAEAAPALARAAALWREAGDRYGQSKALHQLGRARRYLGDSQGALAAFQESLSLKRGVYPYSEANTLYNLARLQADLGDLPAALASYEQAMEIYRAQGDRSGEALILDALGDVHQRQGHAAEALDHFERALADARGSGNVNLEAEALDHLGSLRLRLGQIYPAVDAFAAAVERYRAARNPASEGLARVDLGALLADVGEAEEGRRMLDEALPLLRDPRDQARAGLLLARLAGERGDDAKALELASGALRTSRAMEHPEGEARALCALGFLHLGHAGDSGNSGRASLAGDPALPGDGGLAGDLRHPGQEDAAAAREELARALDLAQRVGSLALEAEALRGLGRASGALGDFAAADRSFERALAIARRLEDASEEARILQELALSRRGRGDLAGARGAIEEALARVESLHARVAGDHLRASHLAAQRGAYEIEVDLLQQLDRAEPAAGLAARAFETAERARARGMLDFLGQARVDLGAGDPQIAREEEHLRLELNARSARRTELLADPGRAAEVAALDRELANLAGHYEVAEARLAASSPGYARLRQPEVRLADLQHEALDADTVLLEYFLAEPRSYLWRVAPDSFASFELPGRERIEALARRVHDELGQPEHGAAARQDLTELSRLLLGPVAGGLAGRRLAVVADGALLYIPFSALPVPAAEAEGAATRAPAVPLLVAHEVVHLPSAAVVRELRRAREGRVRAPETLAVFADPVFGQDDPRLRFMRTSAGAAPGSDPAGTHSAQQVRSGRGAQTSAGAVAVALPADPEAVARTAAPPLPTAGASSTDSLLSRRASGARFARLPWTRREAEVVTAEARGREVLLALDFQANRALATAGDLARYRIVHFATHGVLDTRRPALSGLVLSQFDEQGRARDGFLRLHDVYHLHLDADLVVLSGCETALGKTLRGEGIVGLTRGFFHAGASEVLASLWPVRDRATAELMQRFYHGMLHDRLAPAAALRQAQLSLSGEQPWRDPYFWAGFILEGDWRVPAP
jgi:CHAT domain-containing protein